MSAKMYHLGCVESETAWDELVAAKLMGSITGVCRTAVQLFDGCPFLETAFLVAFFPTFELCTASKPVDTSFLFTPDHIFQKKTCVFSILFQVGRISHRWPDQCETFNYCCDKQQRHLEGFAVQTSPLIAVGECAMIHIDKS